MATGALIPSQRRTPGKDALTTAAAGRAVSPQDQARIATLLQAAGRANQAGDAERLKKTLEEILEIDPGHANATYNLGILYRDRDDIFNAEVHLRRAIKLDPHMTDAYQGLADVLFGAKHLVAGRQGLRGGAGTGTQPAAATAEPRQDPHDAEGGEGSRAPGPARPGNRRPVGRGLVHARLGIVASRRRYSRSAASGRPGHALQVRCCLRPGVQGARPASARPHRRGGCPVG